MKRYIVRRKDFSHFPFQFSAGRDGVLRPLAPGRTFTFAIEPSRDQFPFLHIHILEDFALELEQEWDVPRAEFIRIAAGVMQAWMNGATPPDDHFNNIDMLKVDKVWCPRGLEGAPIQALSPYRFEVETDDEWPFVNGEIVSPPRAFTPDPAPAAATDEPHVVFGYTYDVFPGLLIVGYNQLKRKLADAGIGASVSMLPLNGLPPRVDVLFVPLELAGAAAAAAPHSRIVVLDTFQNHPMYNILVDEWLRPGASPAGMQQAAQT